MFKTFVTTTLLTFVLLFSLLFAKDDQPAQNRGTVDNLKYLVGTWKMTTFKNAHIQKWELQNNRTLSGVHSVVHGQDTIVYARATAVESDSGLILSGTSTMLQLTMRFKETVQDSTTTVFTNTGPEFPTTVTCSRRGNDSLYVKTEGMLNGAPRINEFYFARIAK